MTQTIVVVLLFFVCGVETNWHDGSQIKRFPVANNGSIIIDFGPNVRNVTAIFPNAEGEKQRNMMLLIRNGHLVREAVKFYTAVFIK
ncbi:unnamed protein product [Gongylonema pulchrum]|uniref:Plastocyanin-like domain-containing protein n=1 Tax=Gongylonema pulchrum TaxID=637853 RepID=A0A183DCF1_9BILA|nr:unnamed protein product [Gongylonema pulchrum]